jgi:WD40 repeat protein
MATLHTARIALGEDKAGVAVGTSADTDTLATTISTDGLLVAWDASKVTDRRHLFQHLDRIKAALHERSDPPG